MHVWTTRGCRHGGKTRELTPALPRCVAARGAWKSFAPRIHLWHAMLPVLSSYDMQAVNKSKHARGNAGPSWTCLAVAHVAHVVVVHCVRGHLVTLLPDADGGAAREFAALGACEPATG